MESQEVSGTTEGVVGEVQARPGYSPEWAMVVYRRGYPDRQMQWFMSYDAARQAARSTVYNYPQWDVFIIAPFERATKNPGASFGPNCAKFERL